MNGYRKQNEIHRVEHARQELFKIGIDLNYEDEKELRFIFKGELVRFFPWTGWHSGKSIKDGRGLENLLKQLA